MVFSSDRSIFLFYQNNPQLIHIIHLVNKDIKSKLLSCCRFQPLLQGTKRTQASDKCKQTACHLVTFQRKEILVWEPTNHFFVVWTQLLFLKVSSKDKWLKFCSVIFLRIIYVEKGRMDSVMILATVYQVAKMFFFYFPLGFPIEWKWSMHDTSMKGSSNSSKKSCVNSSGNSTIHFLSSTQL